MWIEEERIVVGIVEGWEGEVKGVKVKDYGGRKGKFEDGVWDVDGEMDVCEVIFWGGD